MTAKAREFASTRLPEKVLRQVKQMARDERRSVSQMVRILVEESLDRRTKLETDSHGKPLTVEPSPLTLNQ